MDAGNGGKLPVWFIQSPAPAVPDPCRSAETETAIMKARARIRLFLAVGASLLLVVLAGMFQTAFWTRDFARALALNEVTAFCIRSGRDPKLLTGAREDTISNKPWSFEWHHDGKPRYLVGVWFSHRGRPELYSGPIDDPESAAYESR